MHTMLQNLDQKELSAYAIFYPFDNTILIPIIYPIPQTNITIRYKTANVSSLLRAGLKGWWSYLLPGLLQLWQ